MQVNRLRMIIEECTRDLGDEGAIAVQGFYRHDGKWWNAHDAEEASLILGDELEMCLSKKGPFRTRNSRYLNFDLPEIQAVIRAQFDKAVRQPRQNAIQRVVLRSYKNASNAYAVKYNAMTGLLGKGAFLELVDERLGALLSSGSSSEELKSEESTPPALCVLALDIDHFKQVNDSYGHAYGDLVIRCFAVRLEHAAAEFCRDASLAIQARCAHVSGEEFFCLAWGSVDTPKFEELARHLLRSVSDRTLPSDEEMILFEKAFPQQELTIPPASSRNITCSIGGIVSGVPASPDQRVLSNKLLHQADLALYKSKAQGRKRATFFPTILSEGGQVIEHRTDVGICVIDIGTEVGVTRGQEFLVFHPDLTGHTPFVVDDGRSRKTLGVLPRVAMCSVTVFDVQRQISFCRASEPKYANVSIPRNATLEAIPLGTLSVPILVSDLVNTRDAPIEQVAGVAETQRRVTGEVKPKDKRSFAVVAILNEAQLLSAHGPGAVNRALVVAYRSLAKMRDIEFIGQVEPTKLLLQFASFAPRRAAEMEEALELAEKDTGGRIKLLGGVFAVGYNDEEKQPLPEIADLRARADLARYAASAEANTEKARVEVFSVRTAERILQKLRQSREFSRGLADYQRFSNLDIVSANIHNSAGLMASASGDVKLSESLYLKAVNLASPSEVVFRLNLVVAQLRLGSMDAAARSADQVDRAELEAQYTLFPFPVYCLAIALGTRALGGSGDPVYALLWTNRALDLEQPDHLKQPLQAQREKLQEIQPAN